MTRKNRKKKGIFDDLAGIGIFDDLVEHDGPVKPEIPESREKEISLIMFWRTEHCAFCHATYEGTAYGTVPLLQIAIEKPIIHFGKLYGWRYHATAYRPVNDYSCYDWLPREVQTIHSTIRRCRKCVHRPGIIYLPAANEDEELPGLMRKQVEEA